MQWENLTSPEFARAVQETKVCVIAFGVVERHGDHLPLGTDFLNGHAVASLAAELEPSVVFPPFYFGQIYEARCFPGTITIKPTLLVELLLGVFDEIGRNGFEKIILFNAHGGNQFMLSFLAQCSLWEAKPYSIYVYRGLNEEQRKRWLDVCETKLHGHACECETSVSLANHAHLVKMDRIPDKEVKPLGRTGHLEQNFSALSWYSNYPEHYVGDAKAATIEKGRRLRAIQVEALAEFIKKVKEDRVIPELEKEFQTRVKAVSAGEERAAGENGEG